MNISDLVNDPNMIILAESTQRKINHFTRPNIILWVGFEQWIDSIDWTVRREDFLILCEIFPKRSGSEIICGWMLLTFFIFSGKSSIKFDQRYKWLVEPAAFFHLSICWFLGMLSCSEREQPVLQLRARSTTTRNE